MNLFESVMAANEQRRGKCIGLGGGRQRDSGEQSLRDGLAGSRIEYMSK